jgi:hypothetical protein
MFSIFSVEISNSSIVTQRLSKALLSSSIKNISSSTTHAVGIKVTIFQCKSSQIKSENNSLQSAKLEARKSFFINFQLKR